MNFSTLLGLKHLAGQHDQMSHGHDGGGIDVTNGRVFSNEEGYQWHEQGIVRDWALNLSKENKNALNDYCGFGYGDINATLRGNPPTREFKRDATEDEKKRLSQNGYKEIDLGDGKTLRQGWRPEVTWRGVDTKRVADVTEIANRINDTIANSGVVLGENIEVSRGSYLPGVSVSDLRKNVGGLITEKGFTSTFLGSANGRADGHGYVSYGVCESKYKRHNGNVDYPEIGTAIKFEIVLPKGTHVASVEAARRTFYKHRDGTYDLDEKEQRSESEILLGSGSQFKLLSVSNEQSILAGKTQVTYAVIRMQYVGGGSSVGGSK